MARLRKKRARSRLAEEYLAWEKERDKERPPSSRGTGSRRRVSPPRSSADAHRRTPHSHGYINGNADQEESPRRKSRHALRRRSPHTNISVEYDSQKTADRPKRKSRHSTDGPVVQEDTPKDKSRNSRSKQFYRHSPHSRGFGSPPRKPRSPSSPKRKARYSPISSDTYVEHVEETPAAPKETQSSERIKRKSRHAQVNADACLDRLPVELKLSILDMLPDLPSLYSITRASPAFYQTYLDRKYLIHSRVITANVDAKILIEALSLLQAARISRSSHWLGKASSFIDLYAVDRSLRVGPEITGKETMHRIAGFHYLVQNIVAQCAEESLAKHPVIGRPSSRSERRLSSTETQRFQRALYRYEIFCRLFGTMHRTPHDYAQDQHRFARVATEFLATFQTFEVEEINCVHRYVCNYYREALQKCVSHLDVGFGVSRYGERIVIRTSNGTTGYHHYKPEREWYDEAAAHCASMGLSFFSRLSATSSSRSRAKLFAPILVSLDTFGSPESQILPLVWQKSYSLDFGPNLRPIFALPNGNVHGNSLRSEEELKFVGEKEGPNAGIVWAGAMSYSLRSEWPNKDWLLSWGYCFWDCDRLNRWHVRTRGYRYIAEVIGREGLSATGEAEAADIGIGSGRYGTVHGDVGNVDVGIGFDSGYAEGFVEAGVGQNGYSRTGATDVYGDSKRYGVYRDSGGYVETNSGKKTSPHVHFYESQDRPERDKHREKPKRRQRSSWWFR